jgi:hypothetical protein
VVARNAGLAKAARRSLGNVDARGELSAYPYPKSKLTKEDAMKLPYASRIKVLMVSVLLVAAVGLSGCANLPIDLSALPFDLPFLAPTPTFTPTPIPTPTPTPEPTATPRPGETPIPPTPTPVPTPQVTIPDGFTPVMDANLGYSLAVPRGWTALDLRGQQFQQLANTFGMGAQLEPLNEFLASPEGESLGVIYVTDLMGAMFGGLPTGLNVFVLDVPGATPEWLLGLIEANLEANAAMLGDAQIEDISTAVINNIPGVRGTATVDLSSQGLNAKVFAKVVGLIANDKVYILTLVTQEGNRAAKEPQFDQIIGTFRPE